MGVTFKDSDSNLLKQFYNVLELEVLITAKRLNIAANVTLSNKA